MSLKVVPLPRAVYVVILLGVCNCEPVVSKLRLEKLMFLMWKEVVEQSPAVLWIGGSYDFRPRPYGPGTEEIDDDVEFLVDLDLVKVTVAKELYSKYFSYMLTEKGKQLFQKLLVDLGKDEVFMELVRKTEEIKKRWLREDIRKLLKYIYERYPEYCHKHMLKHLLR